MIDLSIIIVNHNTCELLRGCLRSLPRENQNIRVESIVIDNGSTDGSSTMVADQFPETVLIRNSSNEGFAKPNNQGLEKSSGRYCMLLNSDTIVRPHALEKLVQFMDEHPDAGACGPRLVYSDGRLQPSCRNFPSLWRHFCDMSGLETFFPKSIFGNFETRFSYDRDAEVDQPMGAALVVRREAVNEVGLLDERFKIYYNEVDWCSRIKEARWKIYFVHSAEIVHFGGKTTVMTNPGFEQFEEMNRNCLFYYEKHFGRWAVVVFRLLMATGFASRVILWKLIVLLKDNDKAAYRLEFAKRSFQIGVRFWNVSL